MKLLRFAVSGPLVRTETMALLIMGINVVLEPSAFINKSCESSVQGKSKQPYSETLIR